MTNALLPYRRTVIQEVQNHPVLAAAGVRVLVKREDLNHPTVSGNKWWKLKYNLQQASITSHKTILTFGGAYSNHIYATASAAKELNMRCIGIIRGEEHIPLNHTLDFAATQGMHIHYVDRATYRKKDSKAFVDELHRRFGDFFVIPEGGTNTLAVKGCLEFAEQELADVDFDCVVLAIGTGGTMAGLICAFKGKRNIVGIPVLKDGGFLENEINGLVQEISSGQYPNWSLLTHYHHGGYAKVTPSLLHFISEMKAWYDLPVDHVYTAKVVWAVFDQVKNGAFKRGETILILHTGGLQGSRSMHGQ